MHSSISHWSHCLRLKAESKRGASSLGSASRKCLRDMKKKTWNGSRGESGEWNQKRETEHVRQMSDRGTHFDATVLSVRCSMANECVAGYRALHIRRGRWMETSTRQSFSIIYICTISINARVAFFSLLFSTFTHSMEHGKGCWPE